jgi:hypothetical protein
VEVRKQKKIKHKQFKMCKGSNFQKNALTKRTKKRTKKERRREGERKNEEEKEKRTARI